MALADRTIKITNNVGKIDRLLITLDAADRDWLLNHLTARADDGKWLYPAQQLAAELADEDPDYAVSESALNDWRRKHPSP